MYVVITEPKADTYPVWIRTKQSTSSLSLRLSYFSVREGSPSAIKHCPQQTGLGTLPPVQAAAECDYHSIMEESMDTKPTSCFVLDDKNLANYRTWLKTVREKARSERGRLTELHLIREVRKTQRERRS